MSFPATYNINYYMGDTFEFRIFPKDASGAPFPLAQYPNVRFTIAEKREHFLVPTHHLFQDLQKYL